MFGQGPHGGIPLCAATCHMCFPWTHDPGRGRYSPPPAVSLLIGRGCPAEQSVSGLCRTGRIRHRFVSDVRIEDEYAADFAALQPAAPRARSWPSTPPTHFWRSSCPKPIHWLGCVPRWARTSVTSPVSWELTGASASSASTPVRAGADHVCPRTPLLWSRPRTHMTSYCQRCRSRALPTPGSHDASRRRWSLSSDAPSIRFASPRWARSSKREPPTPVTRRRWLPARI